MWRLLSGILLAAGIGFGTLVLGPISPPASLPADKSVIDMHAHVAGLGRGCDACFVHDRIAKSYKFDWYLRAFGTSAQETRELGDGAVIERLRGLVRGSRYVKQLVLLALDGVVDARGELDLTRSQLYVPNDYVARLAREHSEFLFGASINPYRHDAVVRLRAAHAAGAVLVKWIPAIMLIDPSDSRIDAFYAELVALGLPLLVHVGDENAFADAEQSLGDPARLRYPLERGVTVIAAHLATTGENAGQENFARLIDMFPHHARLYADISSLTQLNKLGYLQRAVHTDGLEPRLLYGSDWPLQFFPLVSPWYQLRGAPLAELRYAASLTNPLDRDIATKAAVGIARRVFERTLASIAHTASSRGRGNSGALGRTQ
jgi:hypothetical protein